MLKREAGPRLRARADSGRAEPIHGEAVPLSRLLGRRRDDRVVLRGQRDAGRAAAPFRFWDPTYRSTRTCAICPARGSPTARCATPSSPTDASWTAATSSEIGGRASARHIQSGARITRSVLLGADFYEDGEPPPGVPQLGIGRDVSLDRVIVDKNARIGDGVAARERARHRARRRRWVTTFAAESSSCPKAA